MDLSSQLTVVAKLSQKTRTQGTKLLIRIFENILTEPNNQKYKDLNFETISKKFENCKICIDLLFSAGFQKSKDGQRLILHDNAQLHTLQLLHNCLLHIMSNKESQVIPQNITKQTQALSDEENKTMDVSGSFNCICGSQLVPIEAGSCYGGAAVICDKCSNTLSKSSTVYHCINRNSNKHPNGYDLCSLCVTEQAYSIGDAQKSLKMSQYNAICEGIEQCEYLKALKKLVNLHNTKQNESDIDTVRTLNIFHHLLLNHNANEEYEHIYNALGGRCEAEQCQMIQRYFRDRSKDNYKDNKGNNEYNDEKIHFSSNDKLINKLYHLHDLFDQIHYHFRHQYDIGSRLNKSEQADIYKEEQNSKEEKETDAISRTKPQSTLIKLTNILRNKRIKHNMLTNSHNPSKKFSSNLGQIETATSSNECTKVPEYSFSYQFLYKEKCKNDDTMFWCGMRYCDLYVPAKHDSLKTELLKNIIYPITVDDWNIYMDKAMYLKETVAARRQFAKAEKFATDTPAMNHPVHFGYLDGDPITLNHLFVLRLYCGFDEFQEKFTETYRAMHDDDNFDTIKERHSNLHHYAKYIKEAVQVFGTYYAEGDITCMYHGINKEMIFSGMSEEIYSVLSSTYSWNVALQFSAHTGLVLELVPTTALTYFRCEWLSPYPYEGELLFCGGLVQMHFINISNAKNGLVFSKYILSLRAIDTMANGQYFMVNPADVHKMFRYATSDVSALKLEPLDLFIKKLCLALMHHELNRNGYKTDKYKKLPMLHIYIDQLLHQICQNKLEIYIDWNTMNANILKKIYHGGYIAYSFLKPLFCGQDYEGVNLEIITAIFPNIVSIEILELPTIDSRFLENIIKFFQTSQNTKIQWIQLKVLKEMNGANMLDQESKYGSQFKNIGFALGCGKSVFGNWICQIRRNGFIKT